jgi:hypothetical protein
MIHDQAVRLALTGSGLMPADVEQHIEHCGRCRQEIDALRALGLDLARARPVLSRDAEWEEKLIARTVSAVRKPEARSSRSLPWRAAAAVFILSAGLTGALSVLRLESTGRSIQANLSTKEQQSVSRGLDALAFGTTEDSTATLLSLTESSVGDQVEKQSADALGDYLGPADTGGWNG